MAKQRLFVDMDGTIAVFKKVDTLETLYEKDYFLNLEPITNVITAIKQIIKDFPDIEVHTLSAVLTDSIYAVDEKNAWLDKYLPEVDREHRIFTPCGQDKKKYVHIRETDYLLDDYTHNLNLWQPPARGIKLLNGINHTKGSWEHDCLRFDKEPTELAFNIVQIMEGTDRIYDNKPHMENNEVGAKYYERIIQKSPVSIQEMDNPEYAQEEELER